VEEETTGKCNPLGLFVEFRRREKEKNGDRRGGRVNPTGIKVESIRRKNARKEKESSSKVVGGKGLRAFTRVEAILYRSNRLERGGTKKRRANCRYQLRGGYQRLKVQKIEEKAKRRKKKGRKH